MMSVVSREEVGPNSSAKPKERNGEKSNSREERRLFLDCSRENLSISDIEQGFNKNSFCIRINKHVILSVFTIILVCICIIFETFYLSRVLDNRRDIDIIKQDFETLRRQFYDENFLDRLMAFEDQWYDDADEDDSNQDSDEDDYEDYGSKSSSTLSPPAGEEDLQKVLEAIKDLEVKRTEELKKRLNKNLNKTQQEMMDDSQRHKRFIYGRINSSEINLGQNLSNYEEGVVLKKDKKSFNLNDKKRLVINKIQKGRVYRKAPDDEKKLSNSRGLAKRHLRMSRQIFAAHYGADSSLFNEDDEHTGNGRARHNEGVFKAWRSSDWMNDFEMERYFSLSTDGKLTVYETGLYFIYAQIHYLDEHDENGFHLLVNGKPVLQCMVYSPGTGHKSRTCFSAQVIFLHSGDRLVLKDIGIFRYTLFQKDKSFFGLVKLGDLKSPHSHLQSSSELPPNNLRKKSHQKSTLPLNE